MGTGQGSLDDLEKPGLNATEKTKSSYATTQMSHAQGHTDSTLNELTSCGKFKALHAALTCSLWTIDKGYSQIRTSTPPSHGLHVYFERFILPSGKILPSPSFKNVKFVSSHEDVILTYFSIFTEENPFFCCFCFDQQMVATLLWYI